MLPTGEECDNINQSVERTADKRDLYDLGELEITTDTTRTLHWKRELPLIWKKGRHRNW